VALLQDLSAFALRDAVPAACSALGPAAGGPAVPAVVAFLSERMASAADRLPAALARASARGWRAVEIALAGDSWFDRVSAFLAAPGEDRALADRIRAYLDALAESSPGRPADFRSRCRAELREARAAGLLEAGGVDVPLLARTVGRLAGLDPAARAEAALRALGRLAEGLPDRYPHLRRLLEAWGPGDGGTPLPVAAVAYFFRREVAADPELSRELAFAKLDAVRAGQERAFAALGDSLDRHAGRLGDLLDEVLSEVRAVRADVRAVLRLLEGLGAGVVPPSAVPAIPSAPAVSVPSASPATASPSSPASPASPSGTGASRIRLDKEGVGDGDGDANGVGAGDGSGTADPAHDADEAAAFLARVRGSAPGREPAVRSLLAAFARAAAEGGGLFAVAFQSATAGLYFDDGDRLRRLLALNARGELEVWTLYLLLSGRPRAAERLESLAAPSVTIPPGRRSGRTPADPSSLPGFLELVRRVVRELPPFLGDAPSEGGPGAEGRAKGDSFRESPDAPDLPDADAFLARIRGEAPSAAEGAALLLGEFSRLAASGGPFEVGLRSSTANLYWRESPGRLRRLFALTGDGWFEVWTGYLEGAGRPEAAARLAALAAPLVPVPPGRKSGRVDLSVPGRPEALAALVGRAAAELVPLLGATATSAAATE
jgi:hypothetical protein